MKSSTQFIALILIFSIYTKNYAQDIYQLWEGLEKPYYKENSLLDLISMDTRPAFLVHAYDDEICGVEESLLYAEKCAEHGVPVEMHLFPRGGHGFGMGRKEDGTAQWVELFAEWLKRGIW